MRIFVIANLLKCDLDELIKNVTSLILTTVCLTTVNIVNTNFLNCVNAGPSKLFRGKHLSLCESVLPN